MAAPAFTTVSARRTLGGPVFSKPSITTVPTPVAHAPSTKKIDWPTSVREYVQRCFASENMIVGITTEEMQTRLKKVINDAAERSALNEVDWANLPLPQQMLREEKIEAARVVKHAKPWQENISELKLEDLAASPANKTNSKKRKSFEPAQDEIPEGDAAQQLPWRQVNPPNVFEDRITYTNQAQAKRIDKRQRKVKDDTFTKEPSKSIGDLEKRRQRFEAARQNPLPQSLVTSRDDTPMSDAPDGPVVGTCQNLEKNYFRLTAPPKPESVRPLSVLERTLDLLKKKWKNESNYSYICDQFKSLRQDLTVQHIKNEFTVNVYELHARIALEKMDLGEYNQCQTQLRALYKQHLGGHPAEFLAYRILYFIHTCNRTDMNGVLADLTVADREEPAVKHALGIRSALASGNYHRFFQLFHQTPNMGAYLLDMFVTRERLAALANICKAYKGELNLRFLTEELGFESDQDCAAFICDHHGETLLVRKSDEINFAAGKAGPLFESAKNGAFRRVDINSR